MKSKITNSIYPSTQWIYPILWLTLLCSHRLGKIKIVASGHRGIDHYWEAVNILTTKWELPFIIQGAHIGECCRPHSQDSRGWTLSWPKNKAHGNIEYRLQFNLSAQNSFSMVLYTMNCHFFVSCIKRLIFNSVPLDQKYCTHFWAVIVHIAAKYWWKSLLTVIAFKWSVNVNKQKTYSII